MPKRRGRGRSWAWSRNCSRAVAGKTETISIAAMTIMSRSNTAALRNRERGVGRVERMRRSYKNLRGARLNRVYKGETDRDYIEGIWRVRNLMKALRTHEVSLAGCRQNEFRYGT